MKPIKYVHTPMYSIYNSIQVVVTPNQACPFHLWREKPDSGVSGTPLTTHH